MHFFSMAEKRFCCAEMEPATFATSLLAGQILGQQLSHGGVGGPPQQPMMQQPMEGKEKMEGVPTCPMVYAIITDMNVFGNPKVDNEHYSQYPPTYPPNAPPLPALVPLSLEKTKLNVECHISTGFITVKSVWDLNCVRSGAFCDCLLAVPMDNQVCSFR